LYRRAAFGATLTELREAVRRGLPSTLDLLIQGQPDAARQQQTLTSLWEKVAKQGEISNLRGWWMYLILYSLHPLQEKLTLFWHNHFATSIAKVQRPKLMCRINSLASTLQLVARLIPT